MQFPGFVGPTYKLDSVNVDCQRCVNLYPEVISSGTGKEGSTIYYKSTPGLKKLFEVGTGPVRLIHVMQMSQNNPLLPANRVLIVIGNQLFGATYNGTAWTTSLVGTLSTSTGPVTCVNSGYHENDPGGGGAVGTIGDGYVAVLADGEKAYNYSLFVNAGTLYELITPYVQTYLKPSHVVLIDGYYIFNTVKTGQFYISDWQKPALVNALSFASSEGDPDNIVGMIANNRYLWLFNERTTEVWVNSGNADSPFERIPGGFIEKGCIAGHSIKKIDGQVFWLGRDASGFGVVFTASGLTPQRISTHAVESAIRKYSNIAGATAYTYQQNGHSFYVLNFAEATWVYDLSTQMWHERAFTNAGTLERHRADFGAFFPEYNMHLVGDYASNKVYVLDPNYYKDDTETITRMRVAPHLSSNLKRVFYNSLQIDMESGVGLDGAGLGSDPQAMLDWSDDGGHTWSSEVWAAIGKTIGGIGQFKTRVLWRRLGKSRDRVFRLKVTDPVPITIIGAEIDAKDGVN